MNVRRESKKKDREGAQTERASESATRKVAAVEPQPRLARLVAGERKVEGGRRRENSTMGYTRGENSPAVDDVTLPMSKATNSDNALWWKYRWHFVCSLCVVTEKMKTEESGGN